MLFIGMTITTMVFLTLLTPLVLGIALVWLATVPAVTVPSVQLPKHVKRAMAVALVLLGGCTDLIEVNSVCAAIVGGTETDTSEVGAQRSTVRVMPRGCTGVLIAPTVVLTAAHCGEPTYIEADGVRRNTVNYLPHPDYTSGLWLNDLALVFMDGTIPGMLPAVIGWPTYGEAVIQGYGYDETGQASLGILREGIGTIVTFYDEHKFGTDDTGADACFGDSGGPVYQRGLLVGITTSGYPGQGAAIADCSEGGLYTIPSLFQEWLTSEVTEVTFTGKCSD